MVRFNFNWPINNPIYILDDVGDEKILIFLIIYIYIYTKVFLMVIYKENLWEINWANLRVSLQSTNSKTNKFFNKKIAI
jgi:hypothetical protein